MRILTGLLVCLVLTAPAAAQEQRGSIEGIVKDSSGAVLPGVTVEARSPAMVGVTAAEFNDVGNRLPIQDADIAGILLLTMAAHAGAAPREIHHCATITDPGSYELTANLTATGDCLVIAADFVTIVTGWRKSRST